VVHGAVKPYSSTFFYPSNQYDGFKMLKIAPCSEDYESARATQREENGNMYVY
jgi:hypothetical protein